MSRKTHLPWLTADRPPEPGKRPRCKCCGIELAPDPETVWKHEPGDHRMLGQRWTGRYKGYDGFHTLRCALAFARAAFDHGFRVQGGRK